MSDDSFDLDAAGLRADGADLHSGVEVLAAKLELSLPTQCRVGRRGKRFMSREKVVESIDVQLGEGHYTLNVRDGRISAMRAVEVRGVVIRREELGLDAWVDALTAELREQAQGSAEARIALDRLVG